ncbi:hypothetical protein C2U70_15440 [Bradyrhizobium guangdongense]|uniref:hypothetical protein n=1 Tax=Bradyrhizobium guangdongense TaxID=1325090 RepID=UPI0011267FC5|nr:hypothetical protein [Bradyrhizobium guangdongense]TPQ35132.1 hypothetical protein C2U70_15440 [Bradyrhizobium guangdongense]
MSDQAGAEAAAQAASPEAAIDAPSIAPDHEAPPKPDPVKAEAPRIEPPKIEPPKLEVEPKAADKVEPKLGKLIVMPAADRAWDREDFAPQMKAEEKATGTRRLSAMAAVVALAAVVGAISGAMATVGVMHFASNQPQVAAVDTSALETSVARIDADVVALKANLDHTSKTGVGQFNKTNDRLDKLEKAQAEPMAKLAKLSDSVDKLRAAQAAAPAQTTASKEVTGSIAPAQVAAAAPAPAAAPAQVAAAAPAAAPPKVEVGRLPTVEGWRLRDVANGGALIEGRSGLYEVYAGDPIPGLGRVDAIRRQDGRWVVVTPKGLIVAR